MSVIICGTKINKYFHHGINKQNPFNDENDKQTGVEDGSDLSVVVY